MSPLESPGWTGRQQIWRGGEKKKRGEERRGGRKESQGVGWVGGGVSGKKNRETVEMI